ncbi:MAG TPA: hypothetical protein VGL34_02610 [Steroidobacteraceae bacterium]|jgi:ketosteroid isomerase-like protein
MNKHLKAITKKFLAAYDAHDVDSMLTLCAEGTEGKISRLDCYWDNTAINAVKASAL